MRISYRQNMQLYTNGDCLHEGQVLSGHHYRVQTLIHQSDLIQRLHVINHALMYAPHL